MKASTKATDKKFKFHYGHLIVLSCMVFCGVPIALAMSCAGLFFTPVSQSFGVGPGLASYYITFVCLAPVIFSPLAGKIFDRFDSRLVTSSAVLIMVAAFITQSFTTAVWQYWICGFAMGLGVTILLYLAPSTLTNRWFCGKTGGYIGAIVACTGIGGVLWAPIIGALINDLGWQTASQLAGVIVAVCALPFSIFVVRSRPADKGLTPAGYDNASVGSDKNDQMTKGLGTKQALRTKSFFFVGLFGFIINVCMYGYMMTASYITALPLSESLPLLAATVSSFAMAGQTVGKIVLGIIGDRSVLGGIFTALVLGIAGMLGFLFLNNSEVLLALSALCYGVSYGLANVILPIMTRTLFGLKNFVHIYARVSVFAATGSVIAAPLLGSTVDATGSHVTMFTIIVGLFVVAMITATIAMRSGAKLTENSTQKPSQPQ